jgi:hypothetical protein
MSSDPIDQSTLGDKGVAELHTIAESLGVENHQKMRKKTDLIESIVAVSADAGNGSAGSAPAATIEPPAAQAEA